MPIRSRIRKQATFHTFIVHTLINKYVKKKYRKPGKGDLELETLKKHLVQSGMHGGTGNGYSV